jgi:ArsR family transcriptional regulator, arsenate/arsenite/antimonite-responsive transcriptional repressor
METSDALAALAALSHANRLSIFRLLVKAGPAGLAAGRIAELAGLAASSLSFHVKELSRAGLVHQRQESRFIYYAANFDVMNALVGFLTENCCGGNPCSPVTTCAPSVRRISEKSR